MTAFGRFVERRHQRKAARRYARMVGLDLPHAERVARARRAFATDAQPPDAPGTALAADLSHFQASGDHPDGDSGAESLQDAPECANHACSHPEHDHAPNGRCWGEHVTDPDGIPWNCECRQFRATQGDDVTWTAATEDDGDHVHVTPNDDAITHATNDDGDCVCIPTVEPCERGDGSIGWLYVHHSLDNREAHEGATT